jgi:hypothetical protein
MFGGILSSVARRALSDGHDVDKTASCVFVRMGLAPWFGLKAERVRERTLGIYCHTGTGQMFRLSVLWDERDCGIKTSVSYSYLSATMGSTFIARRAGM